MMQSPWPSFLICLAYFIFVWVSPTLMKDRKPMELRNILIVYNLAMVVLSSYTFYEVRQLNFYSHSQIRTEQLLRLKILHVFPELNECMPRKNPHPRMWSSNKLKHYYNYYLFHHLQIRYQYIICSQLKKCCQHLI